MKKILSVVTVLAVCATSIAAHADNIKTQKTGTMVLQPKQQVIQSRHSTALRQGSDRSWSRPSSSQQTNPHTFNKNEIGINR